MVCPVRTFGKLSELVLDLKSLEWSLRDITYAFAE
jgi:hypothetical protein